ncbi:hypothetical protein BDK51DRAFT_38370 [Blyttiomyces helicus]|uniref:F-box domain-containing protein n=1 Tax=Blyttiomyces helicus TaxID=388810 RepID=A0A4P9WPL9_9FUNG|nr:hypothetical protein BDK51DRAFT_38370 [Blyttiomyces helicus]|eukprot:RKO94275.1 hypothetical protein BDK51DRAFT_38370 [Blyttiomyces helicus]
MPTPSVAELPLATPHSLLHPLRMPEILRRIMQTIRTFCDDDGNRTLAAAAGVCRLWCPLACEVLWEYRLVAKYPVTADLMKAAIEEYSTDSSDYRRGGRPTYNAAIDFDIFAASTHVCLLGGPPLGTYLRILDICKENMFDSFSEVDLVEMFTAFHCPRLRAIKWAPSRDRLGSLLPSFAILFRACPNLVALDVLVEEGPYDGVEEAGEPAANPLKGVEDAFWMSDEGRKVDAGIARLQVLGLGCMSDNPNPHCWARFHRALGPNLLEWRGPPSYRDHFNILDQCPNLTHVVGFSFEYDPKKPHFAFPRGKRYPTVKALSFRSPEKPYSPEEGDSIVTSLLQTFPGIAHLATNNVNVTSALFPILSAHTPLHSLSLSGEVSEPTLIAYLHNRGQDLRFLSVSDIAETDTLLDALSSACPRLVEVHFGFRSIFTNARFSTWLDDAKSHGVLQYVRGGSGLVRPLVYAAGLARPLQTDPWRIDLRELAGLE